MTTDIKWLFLGDLQIPYHDVRAVSLVMDVIRTWKPDAIDIVGDIDDQLEYSTYSDGTTDEFFNQLKAKSKNNEKLTIEYEKKLANGDEAEKPVLEDIDPLPMIKEYADEAKRFYADVRSIAKKADIHVSLGNHDIRVFKYIDRKAPEVIDLLTPDLLWGLDDQGMSWRWYHERPFERFGGIHVHHGITSTVTGLAVKNDIEEYGVSLVRGHDHRGGVVYRSYMMPGRSLAGMGTGHLSDVDAYGMRYADNPRWEQGFGIAHVVDDKAHLQFIPIRDYVCVVDGHIFKG
ncbi:MAG TPA: hypothetical protein VIJ87_06505 [Pyrinomonadaceae bacterium]